MQAGARKWQQAVAGGMVRREMFRIKLVWKAWLNRSVAQEEQYAEGSGAGVYARVGELTNSGAVCGTAEENETVQNAVAAYASRTKPRQNLQVCVVRVKASAEPQERRQNAGTSAVVGRKVECSVVVVGRRKMVIP